MTILEFLSSQLDREMLPHQIQNPQVSFQSSKWYYELCFKAREILLKGVTKEVSKPVIEGTKPNVTNKQR